MARLEDTPRSLLARCALLFSLARLCADPAPVQALEPELLLQRLHVRPGVTCLSAESLAPLVEQWLYDTQLPADVAIDVEGSTYDAHSASFHVLSGGRTIAHRTFEPGPPRCEYLRASLGLAIALALKASLLEDLGRPLADDPAQASSDWTLSAAGLASIRILPGFAPGLALRAERALGEVWSLRAAALGLIAPGVDFERTPGGFDAVMVAGRVDACIRGTLTRALHARACVGLVAGPLYARGRGQPEPRSTLLSWFAIANAAALGLMLTERWSLDLELALIVPLRRLSIGVRDRYEQTIDARELAPAGFLLGVGPSYRF